MSAGEADAAALRERHYNATLTGEAIHHGTVMVIRVEPDDPVPEPRPGQWLELGLGVWEPVQEGAVAGSAGRLPPDALIRRSYSLSSPILAADGSLLAPGELDGFEFFLSLVLPPEERAGRVPNLTGRLFRLRPGDRLFLSDAPMGSYTLDPVRPEDDVLFLATGTGEAPHNAMIWDLLRRDHPGRVASIVSARHREDLAYHAVHRRLAGRFPRYRYQAVVTRDREEGPEAGAPGVYPAAGRRLQDFFRDGSLEQWAGFPVRPGSTQVFLCGNPGMIGPPRRLSGKRVFPEETGMVELLEGAGFHSEPGERPVDVHYERYW